MHLATSLGLMHMQVNHHLDLLTILIWTLTQSQLIESISPLVVIQLPKPNLGLLVACSSAWSKATLDLSGGPQTKVRT